MKLDIGGGVLVDLDQLELDLDRCDFEESLYKFLKAGWKHIDPAPWRDGWPIEAVAEHLQAVVDGDIRRLLINIPPRCSKSSLCSVALPAFCWAQPEKWHSPTSGPGVQFLHASYAQQLSVRDSVKCRRLIQSPWYQRLWGDRFKLSSDQNVKGRFLNDKGGERLITSVGSAATGEGGSIIVIDDPNAADEAFSEATVEATIEWWDGTMSTRLNDQRTGAYIVVQQRLAEDDLTGHILSKDRGEWTHLMLPMEYEPERSFVTVIGWEDPRREAGELLWPARFGPQEVDNLKRALGPFKAAGQLQQSPEPAGGGVIKREWWQPWPDRACGDCDVPKNAGACGRCPNPIRAAFPAMDFIVASLDTAYTIKTVNDASALTIWGAFSGGATAQASRMLDPSGRVQYMDRAHSESAPKLMLMHAWNERLELHDLVNKVAESCRKYRVDRLLIEDKAAGHSVAQELRRLYGSEDWGVLLLNPGAQDKLARLYSVQHLFADGMIHAPDRTWADMVINQVSQFPAGKHDDIVDTVSQALRHLRDIGLLVRGQERLEEIEAEKVYTGRPPAPLYPG